MRWGWSGEKSSQPAEFSGIVCRRMWSKMDCSLYQGEVDGGILSLDWESFCFGHVHVWLIEIHIGQVFFSSSGESVWSFHAWCRDPVIRLRKFWCTRQQDMVSRGWRVVGLEWSEYDTSRFCSNVGENVVSPGVPPFSGCAMVEKVFCQ